ncbi:MAG: hypothetical protein ACE5O2_00045 [Armatimonadota bacterium]
MLAVCPAGHVCLLFRSARLLPRVARGTYTYELTLDAVATLPAESSDEQARQSTVKARSVVTYVFTQAPEENSIVGLSVYRILEGRGELLGYQGALTSLLGGVVAKASSKRAGVFVLGSQTAAYARLDAIARRLWPAYQTAYPVPNAPVAVGDSWGDSRSEDAGGGRATADVRSRLQRTEEVDGEQCAVFAGTFEMRTRLGGTKPGEGELDVLYTGKWEAAYDLESHCVRRQTGDVETGVATTSAHFKAVLKPTAESEQAGAKSTPTAPSEAEKQVTTAWKIIAAPSAPSKRLSARARALLAKAADAAPNVSKYTEFQALVPTPGPTGLEGDLLTIEKAAELEPDEPRIAFEVGLFRLALRDPAGALDAFRRAAKLDPANSLPLYMAACAQQAQDAPAQAAETLAEANGRKNVAFYLPPTPDGVTLDPASMRGMLRIAFVPAIARRVRQLATDQIEYARTITDGGGNAQAMKVARAVWQMGRRLVRSSPHSVEAATIGVQVQRAAAVRLQIGYRTQGDEKALARLERENQSLDRLIEKLDDFGSASRAARVVRFSLLTPVILSAAGPPLPLAHPFYLDEQAAVASAIQQAFAPAAEQPGAPAAG